MVLKQAALQSPELDVRFAALCHDLGKATTPVNILPSHHGHEERGARLTEALCHRLRVPGKTRDTAILTARWHTHCHRSRELKPASLVKLMQAMDVVRKPERFEHYLQVCKADARGRLGHERSEYPQSDFLRQVADVFRQVDAAAIANATTDKSTIAARITEARIDAVRQWLRHQPD